MTNLELVTSLYDAFRRGDVAYIAQNMAADVRWRQPAGAPWGGEYRGPGGVLAFFSQMSRMVETLAFDIEENIAAGDVVMSAGTHTCRNRETGRVSTEHFVFRMEIEGGKVREYESFFDSAAAAEAARFNLSAIVETIYDSFRRGDIPAILKHIAPDCFWRQPAGIPWGGDYQGIIGVAGFFERLNELAETTGFEVEQNLESPGAVVSYGFYSSTIRATGRESRARFTFRWEFEGPLVKRYEAVLDTAPIVAAAQAEAAQAAA